MSHQLLTLFNVELVDFVKQQPDGTYVAVEWPKQASHYLQPTSWNDPKKVKANSKGKKVIPPGFALSVCAVPMVRKHQLTNLTLRTKLPKDLPVYSCTAGVEGKRAILLILAKESGTYSKLRRQISHLDYHGCDKLYKRILQANYQQFIYKPKTFES